MEHGDDAEGRPSQEDMEKNEADTTQNQPQRTVPKHTRVSKRRAKTGCLTCRKRRIKCGEQKPICEQCVKSKRSCEGYSQRVVFKNPLSIWNSMTSVSAVNSASKSTHKTIDSSKRRQVLAPARDRTPLAPHLEAQASKGAVDGLSDHNQLSDTATSGPIMFRQEVSNVTDITPPSSLQAAQATGSYDTKGLSDQSLNSGLAPVSKHAHGDMEHLNTSCSPHTSEQIRFAGAPPRHDLESVFGQTSPRGRQVAPSSHQRYGSSDDLAMSEAPLHVLSPNVLPASDGVHSTLEAFRDVYHVYKKPETSFFVPEMHDTTAPDPIPHIAQQSLDPQRYLATHNEPTTSSNGSYLPEPHGPYDMSDVEINSDDESEDAGSESGKVISKYMQNNELGTLVSMALQRDSIEQRLRTYHSVIEACSPNMLTSYHPSVHSSPLTDSTTARIFYHFINVFGPNISSYDRHPADPSLVFQNCHVQTSQQHLWSYVMPTLALSNQALLHAILALGSFHMAKLQNSPITASLKHYHISLRRVAKNVGLPTRRKHPATLATTLLLGYYELMSADHQKWSSHLLGSKQLLKEIDFKGMSTYLRQQKQQQKVHRTDVLHDQILSYGGTIDKSHLNPIPVPPGMEQLDQELVSTIMGRRTHSSNYETVMEESDTDYVQEEKYSKKDIETYETQRDLYWWYCKHDAYQSLLSGNRLFMSYDSWHDCPPRGPVGKREACYGTYDHLVLLTGRLADFASRDIERKRKVMKANGGRWKPPAGFKPTAPPPSNQTGTGQAPTQMPSFPGMLPGTNVKPSLPRGFSPDRSEKPEVLECDELLLENLTIAADREWEEIRAAFDILRDRFGPDYQPLGPEYAEATETPFGPSLQFRTYGIAGIWLGWYWAVIFCQRVHPSMPPAAMMAVGIAAKETALYAREIGRTAAGIKHELAHLTVVNTQVGACLNESTMGLFIAAVQYQGSTERMWTIQRLRDITRLTGWQTGLAVANACETTWSRAAEMGRGPPYVRTEAPRVFAPSIAVGARRVDIAFSENTSRNERLVVSKQDRVHYVLGVLGMEEDFNRLELQDK